MGGASSPETPRVSQQDALANPNPLLRTNTKVIQRFFAVLMSTFFLFSRSKRLDPKPTFRFRRAVLEREADKLVSFCRVRTATRLVLKCEVGTSGGNPAFNKVPKGRGMMYCSRCRSDNVHRSQSSDFLIYRLVLLARVRCHNCGHGFFANCWRVKTEAFVGQVDLAQFDQQLVAVLLKQVNDEFVFRGSGTP